MRIGNKLSNLLKNIGFITIGNFASKIMNFLLIPLYTAKLSTAEYGTADLIFTTLSLLLPILTLEINEAMFRFLLNENNNKRISVFSIGVTISLISVITFLVLSPVLLCFQFSRTYLYLIIALYITNVAYICLSQFAKGCECVKEYSVGGFINTVLVALLNILFLVRFELKIEGYLLAYCLGYLGTSLYFLVALRKNITILPLSKIDKADAKQMLKYSIPLIPNAICWWINNASDKYILALFCTTSVVGVYSIAYKIPSLLSIISSIFFSAWQISAVEGYGTDECRKFHSKIFRAFFLINAVLCLLLVFSAKFLAYILYSNEFFDAWKYSVVLICAFFVNVLSSFLGTIYTTSKNTKMLLYSSLIAAGINIILNFCFIPTYGAYGAAVATLISYVVVLIVRICHTKKIMRIDYQRKEISVFLIALTVVAICVLFEYFILSAVICMLSVGYLMYVVYTLYSKNTIQSGQ